MLDYFTLSGKIHSCVLTEASMIQICDYYHGEDTYDLILQKLLLNHLTDTSATFEIRCIIQTK